MAVLDVRQMVRNGRLQVQTVSALTTAANGLTRFRNIGGTTLTSTDSTTPANVNAYATFDLDDKVGFIVSWCGSSDINTTGHLLLTVSAGTNRRAWQNDLGSFSFYPSGSVTGSTDGWVGKRYILGPFESARFARETTAGSTVAVGTREGNNHIRFSVSASSSELGHAGRVNILAFRMPAVNYAT